MSQFSKCRFHNSPQKENILPRSHALAWECIPDAPASRSATQARCKLHSHAGAWEREDSVETRHALSLQTWGDAQ